MSGGGLGEILDAPQSPGGVAGLEARIELEVAGGGRNTALDPRAVEISGASSSRMRAAPSIRPSAADHGLMWTMLMLRTALARSIGQVADAASTVIGGRTFGNPASATRASID